MSSNKKQLTASKTPVEREVAVLMTYQDVMEDFSIALLNFIDEDGTDSFEIWSMSQNEKIHYRTFSTIGPAVDTYADYVQKYIKASLTVSVNSAGKEPS